MCTNVKSSLCTTATYNIVSHYTSVNKKMGKKCSLFVKVRNVKKHQMENLELKNTITKILNAIHSVAVWKDRGKNQ